MALTQPSVGLAGRRLFHGWCSELTGLPEIGETEREAGMRRARGGAREPLPASFTVLPPAKALRHFKRHAQQLYQTNKRRFPGGAKSMNVVLDS